jgi:hypothetical protein
MNSIQGPACRSAAWLSIASTSGVMTLYLIQVPGSSSFIVFSVGVSEKAGAAAAAALSQAMAASWGAGKSGFSIGARAASSSLNSAIMS